MEAATPAPPPPPPPAAARRRADGLARWGIPARFEAENQGEYNRFLTLVKWLLALPHYIVLLFLGIGALFAILIAFFAVLFTGRFPRGLWDYLTGSTAGLTGVTAYVFLLTDTYPPFSLEDDPGYPVRVEYDYPETVDRWRAAGPMAAGDPVPGRRRHPSLRRRDRRLHRDLRDPVHGEAAAGMFNLIVNPMRWQVRGNAYAGWLVTEYPPFSWDDE